MMRNDEYMSPIFGRVVIRHEYRPDGTEYTVWFKIPTKHYNVALADRDGNKTSGWLTTEQRSRVDIMLPHNSQLFADTEGLDEEMYLLGVMDGVILTILNDNQYPGLYIERVNQ